MPAFDGDNLLITLDSGITSVDVGIDLYSDWKEWVKTGNNTRFPFAFDGSDGGRQTVPGEKSGVNIFFRNDLGWRIKPPEEDIEIVLVGNLFKADVALPMIVATTGAFTVLVTFQRSSLSSILETGTSGLTAGESAQLANADAELTRLRKLQGNEMKLDRANGKILILDDNDTDTYQEADAFEDFAKGTPLNVNSTGVDVRERFKDPV